MRLLTILFFGFSQLLTALDVQCGGVDDTTVVQAAINSGHPVALPTGTCVVNALTVPNGNGFTFLGQGIGTTILQAKSANITLISKTASAGVQQDAKIGYFSVQPSSAGSTAPAIDISGFRQSDFIHIAALSNGSYGFASLFHGSSYNKLCYNDHILYPTLNGTTGWASGIVLDAGGSGNSADTCNGIEIISPFIVDNSPALTAGLNVLESVKTKISGGLIENNSAAVAIKPGQATLIDSVWFELNWVDLDYNYDAVMTPNSGTVTGSYFSTAHNVDFHNSTSRNLWINNVEAGAQTFIGNYYSNLKITGALPGSSGQYLYNNSGALGAKAIAAGDLQAALAGSTRVNGTSIPPGGVTLTQTIASGALSLARSSIPSALCQTVTAGSVNSAAATGVTSADTIQFTPNGSIKAVTGYVPSTSGGLTIAMYSTAGYVNADVCNQTSGSITPGAVTLNYRVVR